MPVYFLDSSALAKQYVAEAGSAWIASMMHPSAANQIHVARISGVEVVAGITKRVRVGTMRREDGVAATAQFRIDFEKLSSVVEISAPLIYRAMDLTERNTLRGYDAIQLAAATMVKDWAQKLGLNIILVSADDELNAAAAVEGLRVENPNSHA